MKFAFLACALALSLVLSGCIVSIGSGRVVEHSNHDPTHNVKRSSARSDLAGSGTVATETRAVADFDELRIAAPVQVVVRVGRPFSVTLEGDDNIVARIKTVLDGEALVVGLGGERIRPVRTPRVHVDLPVLERVVITDNASLEIDGLDGGELDLVLMATGVVRARGAVDDLYVTLKGNGSLELLELVARHVDLRIEGVGSARVHATERLDVDIDGTGAVVYRGDPRTRLKLDGVGQLTSEAASAGS